MASNEYFLKAPLECGGCGPLICKRYADRKIFMVDFSECTQKADGSVDPITAVTMLTPVRMQSYTTAAANLTIQTPTVYNDNIVQGLLVGGRAGIAPYQRECYQIGLYVTTASGQRFEYKFRVKIEDIYFYNCDCDAEINNKGNFKIPETLCYKTPPLFCKTPTERISVGIDFTNHLCLPNGDELDMIGNPLVSETFLSGYTTANNVTIAGQEPLTDIDGNDIGAQFQIRGGAASTGGRSQCYRGYARITTEQGQLIHAPWMLKVINQECEDCC